MAALLELHGTDVVNALLTGGGFRVSRRERGLALLVRGHDVVVVPEEKTLGREKLLTLLDRIAVNEGEFLDWLAKAGQPAAKTRSGFHRRAGVPAGAGEDCTRTLTELVDAVKTAKQRVTAADDDARAALAASRQLLENLPTPPARPDSERLCAVLNSLEEWKEAFREHDEHKLRKR